MSNILSKRTAIFSACFNAGTKCVGFNFGAKTNAINCQLTNTAKNRNYTEDGEWTLFLDVDGTENEKNKPSEVLSTLKPLTSSPATEGTEHVQRSTISKTATFIPIVQPTSIPTTTTFAQPTSISTKATFITLVQPTSIPSTATFIPLVQSFFISKTVAFSPLVQQTASIASTTTFNPLVKTTSISTTPTFSPFVQTTSISTIARLEASCSSLYKSGERKNGVYTVNPDGLGSFQVRCDMNTDGGGWTVFQRRQDASVDFYRAWQDYKTGFGNLNSNFWLGLDQIRRISISGQNVLRVGLTDWTNDTAYAKYASFSVASESDGYRLSVDGFSGTAGDSLAYHNKVKFSTKDVDNDESVGDCAVTWQSAWWYKNTAIIPTLMSVTSVQEKYLFHRCVGLVGRTTQVP